jgi:hypothetical protein
MAHNNPAQALASELEITSIDGSNILLMIIHIRANNPGLGPEKS